MSSPRLASPHSLLRLGALLLALAPLAAAQESTTGPQPDVTAPATEGVAPTDDDEAEGGEPKFRGPPQDWNFRFDLYQRVKFRADLDKGDSSVAVYRTGAAAGLNKWFGYIRLGFRISAERSVYDLSNGEAINSPPEPPTASEPWTALAFTRLNLNVLIPFGRSNWSLFAFGGVRFGGERGTEVRNGISSSLALTVGYRFSDTFSLQAGFLVVTRIEGSPFGFPIIGIRWNPTDWFRLETRGPGVELGVKPVDALELFAAARFDNRQYRLEDRRRDLAEHVLEDQEIVIEFGATWNPIELLKIRGAVGVVAYQEFELRDNRGDTRYRSRTDPAPYLELQLSLLF